MGPWGAEMCRGMPPYITYIRPEPILLLDFSSVS